MRNSYKTFTAKLLATTLVVSSMFNTVAFAATDGSLGATSTGTAVINVTKAAVAKISGMSDMTLASYTVGGGNQALNTTACVYSSTAGGGYTVKATGSGASSAFTIATGSDLIPYTVVWNSGGAGALGTTGAALTTNVTSSSLTNAATDSATCAVGGATAQLNIGLLGTNLDAAPAGTYSGTVTLLVTPV